MLVKRYTSLIVSTSLFVQAISPAVAMLDDSIEKVEQNLKTLKKFSSTPASLDFVGHPEKTAAGVLHWATKNDEVYILLGKRNDSQDQDRGEWCNAGGKSDVPLNLESQNTPEYLTNTADREVQEELNGIYAHHPRLLRKQPVTALYFPEDGLLHYMYWQQVQYLEPAIFNSKTQEAKEGHSKEYTDFMWVKAKDLLYAVVTEDPVITVNNQPIEIFGPLFSTLSTEAGADFLYELATHKKIRRFNKDIRPLCNRLYIEKEKDKPTAKTIPGKNITVHWELPEVSSKTKPAVPETISFGQNAFGKWYTKRQVIDPEGQILSEEAIVCNPRKEEDIFAEAVAAHGMALVELKRRFQPTEPPQTQPSNQWNPKCEETLSRIHLRIVLGPDYQTAQDFLTESNPQRSADIANIKKYFTIDNETEYEQKGNEFKREIKLLDSDYEFFADIMEWEDKNRQWPTFYHGASANLNNLYKSFTYLRELIDLRSFEDLIVLRGTDLYFKNDKTIWDMLNRTGAHENAETSNAMLFLNFVLLAGLKTTNTTSSSAEYVLNNHSVTEQNIIERFEEALALAGFSKPAYAYFQSLFKQYFEHKNPTAGNSVMVAISQNPENLDTFNYPTIGGGYYEPTQLHGFRRDLEEEPEFISQKESSKENKKTEDKCKSTLQILNGIQNEFERQKQSGSEPFETNSQSKVSLFPENRLFLHPSRLMDPEQTRMRSFDRFPLTVKECLSHDQEMRRTTIATMADWLAQKTTIMEGSFLDYPALKTLYKIAYKGMTRNDVIETPSHEGFFYLVRSGHFESVKRYLASYPEILKLIDHTTLANAALESKNLDQIDYFLNTIFKGDWTIFLRDNFKTKLGQTPLHLAIEAKHIGLIKNFLGSPLVDPNIQDNEGNIPLELAAISGVRNGQITQVPKDDIFKLLLAHPKIDVNAKTSWGEPVFTTACGSDRLELVKCLLDHPNINVNAKDSFERTALLSAISAKYSFERMALSSAISTEGVDKIKKVKLLLSHPDIDPNIPADGNTPLSQACYNGEIEIVKLLLVHPKIDVNAKVNLGSPLMAAVYGEQPAIQPAILKLLLADSRINLTSLDQFGHMAFDLALDTGQTKIIEPFLDSKIDINAKNHFGTVLSDVISKESPDKVKKVKLLLSHPDIDPNIPANDGKTPLSLACVLGEIGIVKLLLAHPKINVNAQDNLGSPLNSAIYCKQPAIVKLLLADSRVDLTIPDPYDDISFALALWSDQTDILQDFISNSKIDVNAKDSHGRTTLSKAISIVNPDKVKKITLLLSHKDINPNLCDNLGHTPLSLACALGEIEIVKLLLNHPKIDVNAKDNLGNTPLISALQARQPGITNLLLADERVNLTIPDKFGNMPFDLASLTGQTSLLLAGQNFGRGILDEPVIVKKEPAVTPGGRALPSIPQFPANPEVVKKEPTITLGERPLPSIPQFSTNPEVVKKEPTVTPGERTLPSIPQSTTNPEVGKSLM